MVTSRKEQGVRRMLEAGWTWSGGSVKTSGRGLSWELKDAGEIRVGGGTGQIEVCQAEGTAQTKALRWDRWRAWR